MWGQILSKENDIVPPRYLLSFIFSINLVLPLLFCVISQQYIYIYIYIYIISVCFLMILIDHWNVQIKLLEDWSKFWWNLLFVGQRWILYHSSKYCVISTLPPCDSSSNSPDLLVMVYGCEWYLWCYRWPLLVAPAMIGGGSGDVLDYIYFLGY